MSIAIFGFLNFRVVPVDLALLCALAALRFVIQHLSELRLVELAVDAAAGQQLVVGALLGDDPVLDDEDAVGLENGGEPVRDHNVGAALHDSLQRVLNRVFGDRIQGGGGLVQDQDARVLKHHAGNREPLLFAAGELEPSVADLGVVAVGLVHNEVVDVRDAAGGLQLLSGRVLLGIKEIVADGAVEEIALLRDDADVGAQKAQIIALDVDAVDGDLAAGHVVEAGNEVYQRGLAGAGGADNGVHLPSGDGEIDVTQERFFRQIGELRMLEADDALILHRGPAAVGRGDDGELPVEVIENTREQGKRPGEVHLDVQQGFHRAIKPVDEGDGGGDRADGERRIGLRDHEPAARKVDQQGTDLGEHAHHHAEPLAAALLLEGQARDLLIDGDEALVLSFFAGEELDQQGAGDRQGLVDELVHLVALGLALVEKLPAGAADAAGREDEQGNDHDAHDGKLPAHGKQRDERGHHCGDIAHNAGERAGDDGAHAGDVGIHAGDDVALLLGGEEGVGHVLQMVVHLVFHVKDDALGDPGVDIALQNADDLRESQGKEGHEQELDEQLHVPTDQGLVHNAARDD